MVLVIRCSLLSTMTVITEVTTAAITEVMTEVATWTWRESVVTSAMEQGERGKDGAF